MEAINIAGESRAEMRRWPRASARIEINANELQHLQVYLHPVICLTFVLPNALVPMLVLTVTQPTGTKEYHDNPNYYVHIQHKLHVLLLQPEHA